ncbi:MAG TPA: response regulator [Thermoanaerobaculia bacterium]|nr:response regulator [Thermoanaerobaculia bacterium]
MADDSKTRILVVEDSPLDCRLLGLHLERGGYEVTAVSDGEEAWELLSANPDAWDVVLLDRTMPRMGGLALLAKMKEQPSLRMLPVILQTAAIAPHEIIEGIRAGAYYYLTKPIDPEMLLAIVGAAANDHAEARELQAQIHQGLAGLGLLREALFSVRTIEEARAVGAILANACPEPSTAVIGLTELLLNAIEHGNLGISYEEKSELKTRRVWIAEMKRRLALPENAGKRVEVRYERAGEEARFTIRDEGEGFDWRRFIDIEPARAFDTHGRGIALARRLSFDTLEYRGNGNEVVATIVCPAISSPAGGR